MIVSTAARADDRQDAVASALVLDPVSKKRAKVIVADELAGGQCAVARDHERFIPPHALDLARERVGKGLGHTIV